MRKVFRTYIVEDPFSFFSLLIFYTFILRFVTFLSSFLISRFLVRILYLFRYWVVLSVLCLV